MNTTKRVFFFLIKSSVDTIIIFLLLLFFLHMISSAQPKVIVHCNCGAKNMTLAPPM